MKSYIGSEKDVSEETRRRGGPALILIGFDHVRERVEAIAVGCAQCRAPQFFDLAQGGLMVGFGLDWVEGHHKKQIRGIGFHAKAQSRKDVMSTVN